MLIVKTKDWFAKWGVIDGHYTIVPLRSGEVIYVQEQTWEAFTAGVKKGAKVTNFICFFESLKILLPRLLNSEDPMKVSYGLGLKEAADIMAEQLGIEPVVAFVKNE